MMMDPQGHNAFLPQNHPIQKNRELWTTPSRLSPSIPFRLYNSLLQRPFSHYISAAVTAFNQSRKMEAGPSPTFIFILLIQGHSEVFSPPSPPCSMYIPRENNIYTIRTLSYLISPQAQARKQFTKKKQLANASPG